MDDRQNGNLEWWVGTLLGILAGAVVAWLLHEDMKQAVLRAQDCPDPPDDPEPDPIDPRPATGPVGGKNEPRRPGWQNFLDPNYWIWD